MTPEPSKDEKILEAFLLLDPETQTAIIELMKLMVNGGTVIIE